MLSTTPTIHCDAEDGACSAWDADLYACGASAVDGVRVTLSHRALGWASTADGDFCPDHAEVGEPS